MRYHLVDYINQNFNEMECSLKVPLQRRQMTLLQYLTKMEISDTCGYEITLLVLAKLYNCKILVIRADKVWFSEEAKIFQCPIVVCQDEEGKFLGTKVSRPWYIGSVPSIKLRQHRANRHKIMHSTLVSSSKLDPNLTYGVSVPDVSPIVDSVNVSHKSSESDGAETSEQQNAQVVYSTDELRKQAHDIETRVWDDSKSDSTLSKDSDVTREGGNGDENSDLTGEPRKEGGDDADDPDLTVDPGNEGMLGKEYGAMDSAEREDNLSPTLYSTDADENDTNSTPTLNSTDSDFIMPKEMSMEADSHNTAKNADDTYPTTDSTPTMNSSDSDFRLPKQMSMDADASTNEDTGSKPNNAEEVVRQKNMKTIAQPDSTMHEQEVRVPVQMAMDNTIDVQESREGEIHQTVNNTEMKNSAESDGSRDHTLGQKNEVHKEVPIESVDEDAEEANGNETMEDNSVQKNESTETITADEQTITTEQKKREESEVPNLSHKQNDADVCSEGENSDDKTGEKNANNESDPEVIPPKPKSKTQGQTAMKNIDAFDLKLHDISNISGMESEINISGLKYDDEGKNIGVKYACNKCPHTFTTMSGYNTHLFHAHKIQDVKKYPHG